MIVRIEALVSEGDGLARDASGKVVFVPLAAPGDLAEVETVSSTPGYDHGRLVRLIEPSPSRRTPPCPAFPDCGGCQWQHLDYPAQLAAKETILADALRRIGRFPFPDPASITPSPSEFFYRHRVQVKFLTRGGRPTWGFFSAASHRLVEVRRCLIAHPAINTLLPSLDRFLAGNGVDPRLVGTVEMDVDGPGRKVACILHPRRRSMDPGAHGVAAEVPGDDGTTLTVELANATRVRRMPVRPGWFTFDSAGFTLSSGPGVFSQNNLSLNPRLVGTVLEFAAVTKDDVVADIYCGVGNYSLPLAARAGQVWAVENNRKACRYGEASAATAGLGNIRFIQQNARDALTGMPPHLAVAVINPPRVGAAEIMDGLAAARPRRIVYVSCNPATLARDLGTLAGKGYRVTRLAPFDMFPQTRHLETVALAERQE